jgi:hypothetical protein
VADFADLYGTDLDPDAAAPPIDLDDQSAIGLALDAAELAPPLPPPDLGDMFGAVPADLGIDAAAAGLPPELDAWATPADLGIEVPGAALDDDLVDAPAPPAPLDLAPDFRRVDAQRAFDRLSEPRIDPTQAAQAAQDAESNLRELETRAVTAQKGVLDGQRVVQGLDAQIQAAQAAPAGPERDAQLAALGADRAAAQGALDMDRAAYQGLTDEVATARQGRQSARATYQTELEAAQREQEILGVAAQTAAAGAAAAEDEQILRDARAREAELREREASAQRQLAEDRAAYRDFLERGPEQTTKSVIVSVASVLGEAFAARNEGRPVDFTRALKPIEDATRQDFDRRVQAKLAAIQDSGDALTRAARERDTLAAETAARRAEALGAIERQLEQRIRGAAGTLQQAQLLAVRDDVRAQREAKEAEYLAAQAKLERDRQRDDLERRKLKADVGTAEAKRLLEERKARGGSGAGRVSAGPTVDPSLAALPPKEREKVEERGVRDPITGQWLRTEDGRFVLTSDGKAAKELRDQAGAVRDYTRVSNRLADLVQEHGMEPRLWRGEVRQEMDSLVADLLLITKNAEQTGALDNGSVKVITEKISGGITPGDFGSSAEVILKGTERLQQRFQGKTRDYSTTGIPAPASFPDTSAQRGEIERNARAGEEARRVSDGDHTGTPTAADPLGEADAADKFATDVRAAVVESEQALKRALDMPDTGAASATAMIPALGAQVARAPRLRELAQQIQAGDRTPAVRDEFERLARESGMIGGRRNFLYPDERSSNIAQAQANERRADAVRVANWLAQNRADPRKVDLGYLRKIGVVRFEHADKAALGRDVADAYRRYTAPAAPAKE